MTFSRSALSAWRVAALAALLSACGQDNTYVAPPPPKVTVAVPVQQVVTRYLETTGNTTTVNSANLVARVQGFLQAIHYRDGDMVKQGTPLFTIEPETYKLKLDQAKASEAAAQAALRQAESEYERQTELATRQVASKAALDNATANRDSAQAKLQQARVETKLAEMNYGYAEVVAPFDGIVTARQVSVGELVGAGGTPTVLATIVQLDPIYVSFSVNERDLQIVRAVIARLGLTDADIRKIQVEVGLQTESGYPHRGTLEYAAPAVTQSTGTIAIRALFKNANELLLPGYFVRVRVPYLDPQTSLLVPDTALGSDQGGRYVLLINKDNVVEQRKVEIGPPVGELRVIENGLKPDDRVVVTGLMRAIPGQKVEPTQATLPRGDSGGR